MSFSLICENSLQGKEIHCLTCMLHIDPEF